MTAADRAGGAEAAPVPVRVRGGRRRLHRRDPRRAARHGLLRQELHPVHLAGPRRHRGARACVRDAAATAVGENGYCGRPAGPASSSITSASSVGRKSRGTADRTEVPAAPGRPARHAAASRRACWRAQTGAASTTGRQGPRDRAGGPGRRAGGDPVVDEDGGAGRRGGSRGRPSRKSSSGLLLGWFLSPGPLEVAGCHLRRSRTLSSSTRSRLRRPRPWPARSPL